MSRPRTFAILGGLTALGIAGACSYDFEAFDPRQGEGTGGATATGAGTGTVTGTGTDTGTPTGQGGGGVCDPGDTAPCYTGDPDTEDVGVCHGGTTTCNADGSGFGACEGEVTPIAEDCNTAYDDDCDGEVNEPDASCQCTPGETTACYSGNPADEGVGNCFAGLQVCGESGTEYGPCFGESLPVHEDCATLVDDDCDDVTNDHCATWSRRFGGGYDQVAYALAVDGNDQIVIAGVHRNSFDYGGGSLNSDNNGDALVLKLDSTGNHLWSAAFGDNSEQAAYGVGVDGSNDVYVAGDFFGTITFGALPALTSAGERDIFVAKLSGADGTPVWATRFGDNAHDEVYDLAVDAAGNVILTGAFTEDIDFGGGPFSTVDTFNDGYLVKLSGTDGSHIWSYQFGGADDDNGDALAVDGAGAFYLTGQTEAGVDFGGGTVANGSSRDAFVVKFDAANAHVWSIGISGSGWEDGEALTVDSSGNVWAGGDFENTVILGANTITSLGDDDFWVAKLDPTNGAVLWGAGYGGAGDENLDALAADGLGNVLLGGSFEQRMDLGDGEMIPAAEHGSEDWFFAAVDGGGTTLYSRRFGGPSSERILAAGANSANRWIVAGFCDGVIDLGNGQLTSGWSDDICVAEIAP
ncbi:MAG: hypothetical protein JRI23_07735 [Deltaproteobacteria bacterium]|jgi:hypothetical protein|nr:hypothetical protein [Deltaproteobacteria bacterium]MBW2531496.1 hypothetical protein [Deltaproteobacteria bacterium]